MSVDPDDPGRLVHGLANHVGALLLGLDLLRDEPELAGPAAETVSALLEEARAASDLVARLQGRIQRG